MLVASEQSEALAQQILRLGSDPELRRRLGEQARLDVVSHFSLDSTIGSLVERFK